jgi:hypothetical protein
MDTNQYKRNVYDASSGDPSAHATDYDQGVSRMNRTNALLAGTIVAGVFTGVTGLWLTDWRGTDRTRADRAGLAGIVLAPGSVAVHGTFR